MHKLVADLNVCGKKGLVERFDSTIGAATVLLPFGGARQLTPAKAMVARMPVLGGQTTTVSGMSWGFNPYLSSADQFSGAYCAVLESVSKLVATGFSRASMHLTLQEYFGKLHDVPERWGRPAASLLGALMAQVDLGVGAIGGKDSMSGSFEQLDVPPTLVSFAAAVGAEGRVTSPEFKQAGHRVVLLAPVYEGGSPRPVAESAVAVLDCVEAVIGAGQAAAVSTCGFGAAAAALFEMCLGNRLGLDARAAGDPGWLFELAYGSFLVELADGAPLPEGSDLVRVEELGETTADYVLLLGDESIDLADLEEAWGGALESVFPWRNVVDAAGDAPRVEFRDAAPLVFPGNIAEPRVIIPVFPGNNCEYDSAAAFERAGAKAQTFIVNNLTPAAVAESTHALARAIRKSQILMIPGGFSGGDEPDGSAKFITAFFRAPEVTDAVRELLDHDGLILGICNGFQALVKLGLVPFGDIRPMDASCPTLTFNEVGRHQSMMVRTRVASTLSPWLSRCEVGQVHTVPISNGEGRFVASPELLEQLAANGQIATQYVDESGAPTASWLANPSGSMWAIEGITSPDGRVFGKMGHTERTALGLHVNFPDLALQPLFEGGVDYFA